MSNVTCPRCGETYDHGKGGHFCLRPADGGDPYARISTLEARVEELTRELCDWAAMAAARGAERDEAVGLLREAAENSGTCLCRRVTDEDGNFRRVVEGRCRIHAYLARLAPAPEKETTP